MSLSGDAVCSSAARWGADGVGVGDGEVGIEGESVMPMLAGLAGGAGGMVGVGQAVMGAGLFVLVAYLTG